MDLGLDNRVIIVSGGARGIGGAITNAIAAEGGLPIVVDPLIDEGRALINSLERQGLKAHQIGVRLVSADDCAKTVKEVKKRYGRIDGVVNNAGKNDGIGLENGGPKAFVQSVTNNLFHCYYLVHYALPFLIESQGSIVNISSKTAVTGQGGTSGYAAAKGAQLALNREWAVELLKYQIKSQCSDSGRSNDSHVRKLDTNA